MRDHALGQVDELIVHGPVGDPGAAVAQQPPPVAPDRERERARRDLHRSEPRSSSSCSPSICRRSSPRAWPSGHPPIHQNVTAGTPLPLPRRGRLSEAPRSVARRLPAGEHPREGDRGRDAAALHAVPEPRRLRDDRAAGQRRDPDQHPRPPGDDRGVPALLLLRHRPRAPRRAGPARGRVPADHHDDRVDRAAGVRGAAQRGRARPSQPGDLPRRGARAVVVHEPRARLPAVARRRAAAAVRDRVGDQRGADGRGHDHARDRPAQGPRGVPARQLRRDHADPLLAVVQAARPAAPAGRPRSSGSRS